jgi:hypothetical protein
MARCSSCGFEFGNDDPGTAAPVSFEETKPSGRRMDRLDSTNEQSDRNALNSADPDV